MIISLISSAMGMVGGLVPDIFKEVRETLEYSRELVRMDKTAELQLKMLDAKTDAKLAEVEGQVYVEEMKAFGKQMEAIYRAQQSVGIKWVDGFNAVIRPATAMLLMLMFVITGGMYITAVLQQFSNGVLDLKGASEIIWGSLVGDAIQAVLGFLFGYRSTKGRIINARRS